MRESTLHTPLSPNRITPFPTCAQSPLLRGCARRGTGCDAGGCGGAEATARTTRTEPGDVGARATGGKDWGEDDVEGLGALLRTPHGERAEAQPTAPRQRSCCCCSFLRSAAPLPAGVTAAARRRSFLGRSCDDGPHEAGPCRRWRRGPAENAARTAGRRSGPRAHRACSLFILVRGHRPAFRRPRGDRAARPRVMAARVRRRRLALMAPMPRARGEQTPREETAQSRAAP